MVIQKLDIVSFARFQAVLGGLIGLVCGILYSFSGLIIDALVSLEMLSPVTMETPGLSSGTVLAFGALIGMPVIFMIAGFILGLIEAILYNLFAKWFGGLKIDLN
ncbi:DUF3566 domain-containing protein [Christiangramia aquimixticola]|uniref:DUF3566 domain-containing protein n=1 Tax=Christiangramia aquimixticola TaxID=1697558 RepID=UPI003AA9439F